LTGGGDLFLGCSIPPCLHEIDFSQLWDDLGGESVHLVELVEERIEQDHLRSGGGDLVPTPLLGYLPTGRSTYLLLLNSSNANTEVLATSGKVELAGLSAERGPTCTGRSSGSSRWSFAVIVLELEYT
jgi:hypothetical protein